MSDLKKYIAARKKTDKAFAEGFEEGYEQFKIELAQHLRHVEKPVGPARDEPVQHQQQKGGADR